MHGKSVPLHTQVCVCRILKRVFLRTERRKKVQSPDLRNGRPRRERGFLGAAADGGGKVTSVRSGGSKKALLIGECLVRKPIMGFNTLWRGNGPGPRGFIGKMLKSNDFEH